MLKTKFTIKFSILFIQSQLLQKDKKINIDIKLIDLDGFIDICKVCDQEKILNYLGYGV